MMQINKILIFDTELEGHHLEYLHHIYEKAIIDKYNFYIFAISDKFKGVESNLSWPVSVNVKFDFLDDSDILKCKKSNIFINSFHSSMLLKDKIFEHGANKVFLISLMSFLPFLPLLVKNVKISGIIYMIYLYRWSNSSLLIKFFDVIKYFILTRSSIIQSLFVLNDVSASFYLNKLYKSIKFAFLPDPYLALDKSQTFSRDYFNIGKDKIVYLHFGALTRRKGTINIIKAIEKLNIAHSEKLTFIFAGRIFPDISTEFYSILKRTNRKCQIIVYDEFCSFEFLASLIAACDFILIPYFNSLQSSGVLGHSAFFRKPVVGPNDGLLGKNIRKYSLGYNIQCDEIGIFNFIIGDKIKIHPRYDCYLSKNSKDEFIDIIFPI